MTAMASAAIVSGTIDASTRQGGSSFDQRSIAVGGVAAAITGVAALLLFDQDSKVKESERRIESLSSELDIYRGKKPGVNGVVSKGDGLERDLPPDYRGLVRPGSWSIYQIDQWVASGENTMVHQDKMIQIENPRFDANHVERPKPNDKQNDQKSKKGEKDET